MSRGDPLKENRIEEFLAAARSSIAGNSFQKLTLGKLRGELAGRKNIYIRLVTLKSGTRLSFVHRYPDRDITLNHPVAEGLDLVRNWLGKSCLATTLLTSSERIQVHFNRRGEGRLSSEAAPERQNEYQHDRQKNRRFEDESFLRHLGITNAEGIPLRDMGDKYRQIHHFIELLAPMIRPFPRDRILRVIDLASGKGYLTFGVYSFLQEAGFSLEVTGIERRKPLVDLCNRVADECRYKGIRFESGEISGTAANDADVVIALHACDTATDDAIYAGIRSEARIILVAPCCHKELRPQLRAPAHLEPLFRDGIQIDRMAESITDALRSMYLEASGYSTRIQEFISVEHTSKNLLILAAKDPNAGNREHPFKKALEFQHLFGIRRQHLGGLLGAC